MQYLGDTFRRRILRSRFRQCDGHRNDETDDDRYDSGCKCSDQVENDDGFQSAAFSRFCTAQRTDDEKENEHRSDGPQSADKEIPEDPHECCLRNGQCEDDAYDQPGNDPFDKTDAVPFG